MGWNQIGKNQPYRACSAQLPPPWLSHSHNGGDPKTQGQIVAVSWCKQGRRQARRWRLFAEGRSVERETYYVKHPPPKQGAFMRALRTPSPLTRHSPSSAALFFGDFDFHAPSPLCRCSSICRAAFERATPVPWRNALGSEGFEGQLAAARDGRMVRARRHLTAAQRVTPKQAHVSDAAHRARPGRYVASPSALIAGETLPAAPMPSSGARARDDAPLRSTGNRRAAMKRSCSRCPANPPC